MKKSVLIAYVPVIHVGYLGLLERHPDAEVLIVDDVFLAQFRPIQKDVRKLAARQAVSALQSLVPARPISVLDKDALEQLQHQQDDIHFIAPRDEVLEELFAQWKLKQPEWDTVFLRWTRTNSEAEKKVQSGFTVTEDEAARKFMERADQLTERSSDWWRQVAAVLVKDGQVVASAYNTHSPVSYSEYRDGDPRANYSSGIKIELSTSIHAEASIISLAAAQGLKTAGCDLYVSTFPCPYCARMLAQSGIHKLYFRTGYSLVDGADVLQQAGIELVQVV